MNKRSVHSIALFTFAIILLTSCAPPFKRLTDSELIAGSSASEKQKTTEEGFKTIIEAADHYTLSVHYPVTESAVISGEVENFASDRIELYRQEVAELYKSSESKWPFELHLAFEIPYFSASHLTIVFTESKYLGGTQNQVETFTLNYDLTRRKKLAINDLFNAEESYLEILAKLSYDHITIGNTLYLDTDLAKLKDSLAATERNFSNFAILHDQLRFYFDKNQLGTAFSNVSFVAIPLDTVKSHLTFKPVMTLPILPTLNTLSSTPEGQAIIEDDKEVNLPNAVKPPPVQNNVRKSKKIALTFETGPHPTYTPIILDSLKSRDALATFFFTGQGAQAYSSVVVRTYLENHLIGNASYNHPQMVRLSTTDMVKQITQTQSILSAITLEEPFLFRPPYGDFNDILIKESQMPIILWSIDPQDWIYQDSDYIVTYVLDHAFDGAIIRLRDTLPSTTQAIGPLIDGLSKAGYELVTVSELLGINRGNMNTHIRAFSKTIQ